MVRAGYPKGRPRYYRVAPSLQLLSEKESMDFIPIVFTTSGGMGEQFQRQSWNPHWKRVEEEDEAMRIGPCQWAARKRKAILQARFASAVEIAKCNARMISRPQHTAD
jgi:hypothetical protein